MRGRETSMCGCLLRVLDWGPGLWPRPMPWLGIEPVTLTFSGWCSIHWATPARATLCSLNKLFYFSNNSQVSISLKKELSHTDGMASATGHGKLSWQAAELDLNVDLSDDKSLGLSDMPPCLSWEIDTTTGQGELWDSGKCYLPCKK